MTSFSYIDEAIQRFAAEEEVTPHEWFMIIFVEDLNGKQDYIRLKPRGQTLHSTGGLVEYARIAHEEQVRGRVV